MGFIDGVNKDNVDDKFFSYHRQRKDFTSTEQVDICKKMRALREEKKTDKLEKDNYRMKLEAENKKLKDDKYKEQQKL